MFSFVWPLIDRILEQNDCHREPGCQLIKTMNYRSTKINRPSFSLVNKTLGALIEITLAIFKCSHYSDVDNNRAV